MASVTALGPLRFRSVARAKFWPSLGTMARASRRLIKAISGAVAGRMKAREITLEGQKPIAVWQPRSKRARRGSRRFIKRLPCRPALVHHRQHVHGPGDPASKGRLAREVLSPDGLAQTGDGEVCAGEAVRSRADDHSEHQSGGGDPVWRAAPRAWPWPARRRLDRRLLFWMSRRRRLASRKAAGCWS